ncbi:hypothetical protein L596_017025 [Steinernema carpocapsae]|uniref:Uncharacterized protein n=1 Tax=Steinernema carpocapsae TaxID=34508 RepID=A0A4U5N150_STECR|nr:hypothetical protein L596_017025 [Steinernema carpocapsae]
MPTEITRESPRLSPSSRIQKDRREGGKETNERTQGEEHRRAPWKAKEGNVAGHRSPQTPKEDPSPPAVHREEEERSTSPSQERSECESDCSRSTRSSRSQSPTSDKSESIVFCGIKNT